MTIQQVYEKTKNFSVLFVEDEQGVRDKTSLMLKDLFLEVDTSIDGEDGLEQFQKYYNNKNSFYDLVITDINMPNLDGLSMVEQILQINPNQEVIVVSAYGDYEKLQTIINFGIKSYIKKPIEINDFLDKLYLASTNIETNIQYKNNLQKIQDFEKLVQNSNQVFIIFDKNCVVEKIFKSQNMEIFNDYNVIGKKVSSVMYPNNTELESMFDNCFELVIKETNELNKKLLTTTLPKEYIYNNQVFNLEYNILSDDHYLVVLADQTIHYNAKAELMMQKSECQMMLWAALHKSSFLKLKDSYEEFLSNLKNLIEENDTEFLNSKIKTYLEKLSYFQDKFDTINMNNAKDSIARFEKEYNRLSSLDNNQDVSNFINSYKCINLKDGFEKDIQTITNELSKVLNIE
jgi:CheY-like chemotaxis protein